MSMSNDPIHHRNATPLPEVIGSHGVALLESHHASSFRMDWRTHPFLKLIYVLEGAGKIHVRKRTFEFERGDFLSVPSGYRNRIVDAPDRPASLYVLCIMPEVFRFAPAIVSEFGARRWDRSSQFGGEIRRRLRRIAFLQSADTLPGRPPSNRSAIVGIVAETLSVIALALRFDRQRAQQKSAKLDSAESESAASQMRQYVHYLETHFFEVTDIDDAAARLGMSRRQFTSLFRETTGTTWLRFVRDLAIQHAAKLLTTTNHSAAAIAFECGFEDITTFYRWFQKIHGMAPMAMRDLARKPGDFADKARRPR